MTTKNYLQKYISQKVKYFRTQNKMSQEELSEQAGLGRQRNFSILTASRPPLTEPITSH